MTSRSRTIKRIALVLTGTIVLPALLLASYVSAWLLFVWWATPAGRPADPYLGQYVMHPAFAPIDDYTHTGGPGADLLLRLRCVVAPNCD